MKALTSAQLEGYVVDLARQNTSEGQERCFAKVNELAAKIGLDRVADRQVIVGGTNGKGTTVAYLQQLLTHQGLKVGTTTSPHLHQYVERIALDGIEVDATTCYAALKEVAKKTQGIGLTYFDLTTLCALYLFKQWQVDVAIVEVGLGGRSDCANVIDADVSILTNVDLDHCNVLGNTIEFISQEKVAIARTGKPLLFADSRGNETVERYAQSHNIPLYRIEHEFGIRSDDFGYVTHNGASASLDRLGNSDCDGEVQITAIQAATFVTGDVPRFASSELQLRRPQGRIEQIVALDRLWILDIGHNPAGIHYLLNLLFRRGIAVCSVVFAALRDKDVTGMLTNLTGKLSDELVSVKNIVITDTVGSRGLKASADCYRSIRKYKHVMFESDLTMALDKIASHASRQEPIVVLGSVDLVSRTRTLLQQSSAV